MNEKETGRQDDRGLKKEAGGSKVRFAVCSSASIIERPVQDGLAPWVFAFCVTLLWATDGAKGPSDTRSSAVDPARGTRRRLSLLPFLPSFLPCLLADCCCTSLGLCVNSGTNSRPRKETAITIRLSGSTFSQQVPILRYA